MIKVILAAILTVSVSACTAVPNKFTVKKDGSVAQSYEVLPGTAFDMATTALALAKGGREVGLAGVCGSDPALVMLCVAAQKTIIPKLLTKVVGQEKSSDITNKSGFAAGIWNMSQITN